MSGSELVSPKQTLKCIEGIRVCDEDLVISFNADDASFAFDCHPGPNPENVMARAVQVPAAHEGDGPRKMRETADRINKRLLNREEL
jgi:hypothetical protein